MEDVLSRFRQPSFLEKALILNTHILVTGGTGFIGSHTCIALLEAGHQVLILDNLCNSDASVVSRIGQISGHEPVFVEGDIRDKTLLKQLFESYSISAVLHFAGLKAVGESVDMPLNYYENNVGGTIDLLTAMREASVKTMVFSSSATVYGDPKSVPITEDFPLSTTNPYGATKLMIEGILADLCNSEPDWCVARLRYFNPVGAHKSGLIGENPKGTPNNLMPFISQTAAGLRDQLSVFGKDYPTIDGTGVRDYIHVVDLANGHVAALNYLSGRKELLTVNLGTGQGVSVLQMIKAFESINACKVPYQITERRAGDIAECWADTKLANDLLGWRASLSLEDMCRDTWRWQTGLQDHKQADTNDS
jgi:UDP-glucose 4-epimerase